MKKSTWNIVGIVCAFVALFGCAHEPTNTTPMKTAAEILGNPEYQAISYGGYRAKSREVQPTIQQLKNDMKIMHAMGIRVLRTYNLQLDHAPNVLRAIRELKQEDPTFEMYVMLGPGLIVRMRGRTTQITILRTRPTMKVRSARRCTMPTSTLILLRSLLWAMRPWCTGRGATLLSPGSSLKYVNYLQELKTMGKLSPDLWITSSDNFASWGGGSPDYHNEDLEALVNGGGLCFYAHLSFPRYPLQQCVLGGSREHGGRGW